VEGLLPLRRDALGRQESEAMKTSTSWALTIGAAVVSSPQP
jgi:hypothetical protein